MELAWVGASVFTVAIWFWFLENRVARYGELTDAAGALWANLSKLFDPNDSTALRGLLEDTPWPDDWAGNMTNKLAVQELARRVQAASEQTSERVERSRRKIQKVVEAWGRRRAGWHLKRLLQGDVCEHHRDTLKLWWYATLVRADVEDQPRSDDSSLPISRVRDAMLGRGG